MTDELVNVRYMAGRVAGPLAKGGQGPGADQHRADRDAEHADQWMPSASPVAGVGDLGEGVEQAAALVGGQRGGCGQPLVQSQPRFGGGCRFCRSSFVFRRPCNGQEGRQPCRCR